MNKGTGLGITDEHLALADSVQRFARRHLTAEVLRSSVEADPVLPEFWRPLADQGLLALHIDTEHGGQGAGLTELAVALEAIGATAAPGPYVPTVLAAGVLVAAAGKAREALLPGLADGSVRAAVALGTGLSATTGESGALTVTGTTGPVLGADLADVLVLPVEAGGDTTWVVLDTADVTVGRGNAVDVTRATVPITARGVHVEADRVLEDIDSERVEQIAAVVLGAEAVGLTSWCVSTAAQYAQTREQFGRPIGQFQGVKHRCAHMGIALEQARAAVWDAARALDAGDADASFAAAIARAVAPDAAVSTSRDCIQVLGGIGFTWEHDAHLYYRRALTLRGLLGRSRDAMGTVARMALDGGSRAVHVPLPAEADELRANVRAELTEIARLDPEEQLRRLGDGGWVMPHLPPPSGRAAGPLEQVVIAEELKHAGVTTPELALAAWLLPSIALHGTEQQRIELVAPTLRGEIIWCQMFSEPGAGSDLASLRTEAVKVDGGWRVNGQKIWTSLGFLAEWGVLLARTEAKADKHDGITYFLVRMDTEGITVRPLREMSGGALFSQIFFDDVFIPDSGVVGEVGHGWQVARGTLANERVALGKGNAMYATVRDLVAFARKRSDVDTQRVGELICEDQTLRLLNARALLKQLRGADSSITASVAKFLNMRFGQQVADFCHAELGLAGLTEGADVASGKWIDQTLASRAMTIYGGTTEIQLNVIGERMLGLPRDPLPGG